MDVFETDYSNLFAAGLRGIQSRTTGRSCSEPQLCPAAPGSADSDQDVIKRVQGPTIPFSFWKTFLLSTRLLRRPSRSPRGEKTSSAVRSPNASREARSKRARHSIPSEVGDETSLNLRILDWSVRVSNATATLDAEDECVDPYLFDKVDPVDVPASTRRTTILVTLPTSTSLGEQVITPVQGKHDRRVSIQSLPKHMVLPALPYHSFFALDEETDWESDSASSSEDDWHQFRVEWIDFDGVH